MPNTSSSKKRLRQNEKLRIRNRAVKSNMRSQIRRFREAVKAGDSDLAQTEYRLAQKKLDKAASSHLLHKNTVARTKSRMVKLLKSVG
jgi:small subunit ribosomal protein S20